MAYIVFSGEEPKVLCKVEALDDKNVFEYYIIYYFRLIMGMVL